jgi:L-ascorbate metabolism protein UlaG (beta-lactamase superfamily)
LCTSCGQFLLNHFSIKYIAGWRYNPTAAKENYWMTTPTRVTYLGHSTLLIEMDGVRILTDPMLRKHVTFLVRNGPPIDPTFYQNIDAILISHLHYDHLDFPSLRLVNPPYRLIVPFEAAAVVEKGGFGGAEELKIGASTKVGPLEVRAVFADHVRQRGPGGPAADCVGYILRGSHNIYFPGDTALFPEMASLAEDLDLVFMPVWGWGANRGKKHMGPDEAAQAVQLLQPRYAIPIHWGSFVPFGFHLFSPGFSRLPPLQFEVRARQLTPDVQVHVLPPGKSLELQIVP